MIVVIADDLTGAAEIGGIAMRYGLSAEIVTKPVQGSDADVLILATDTRSMTQADALKVTEAVSNTVLKLKPEFVYKKVDSVMRGHIVAELYIHQTILGYQKALLVPANPAFGRTITDGRYYVNGKPIHETDFANDPEFPVTAAEMHIILRVEKDAIFVAKPGDPLPRSGVIVGEVGRNISGINTVGFHSPLERGRTGLSGSRGVLMKRNRHTPTPLSRGESHGPLTFSFFQNTDNKVLNNSDLGYWAKIIDNDTLAVGSSGFFSAILETLSHHKIQHTSKHSSGSPSLIVCGSSHEKSRNFVETLKKQGQSVSYMPAEVAMDDTNLACDNWAEEIVSLIKKNKTAIIAIDKQSVINHKITAAELRIKKAVVIEKVFAKVAIKELIIEGGSTAAAIINQLNFNRFFPVDEPGEGVIKMKVAPHNNLFLTLKPGSYEWPAHILNF